MRTPLLLIAGVAVVLTAGCEPASSSPAAPPPVTVTKTTTPKATAVDAPPSVKPSRSAAKRVSVPNVVGHNHQAAQDELQAAGLYRLREVDATGQGRMLLWDRNWVVVRQSPSPGTRVPETATITLYSKKIGE